MLESAGSFWNGNSMAQSCGRSTDFQSASSKSKVPTGPKFPDLEKLPLKLKSCARSVACPKWKRQPESSSRRSRPAPCTAVAGGALCAWAPSAIAVSAATATAAGTARLVLNISRRVKSFIPISDLPGLAGESACPTPDTEYCIRNPLFECDGGAGRSEEHTSELPYLRHLVCR